MTTCRTTRFVKAQLAGDLLDAKVRERRLPGTAILGQGPWWWDQAEPVQGRADERNERIDMVTRGMLGLTVACARCHDHKYDPISQKDYYSLAAVFLNTTYHEYPATSPAEMAVWEKQQKSHRRQGRGARRVHGEAKRSVRGDAGAKDIQVPGGGVAGDRRAEEEGGRSRGGSKSRSRNAGALDQVPGQAAQALFVPARLAGHGEERRHAGAGAVSGGSFPESGALGGARKPRS